MKLSFNQKLTFLIILLFALVIIPWAIWHQQVDAYFASQEYRDWIFSIKSYAWILAIGLLVADLLLPIPATPILAMLGQIYGTLWGGIIGATGSVLAGLTAYLLARFASAKIRNKIASPEELESFTDFFNKWGAAGIIASRVMPVLPEILTLLAGVAKMSFKRFMACLLLGSVSAGYFFAFAGDQVGQSSLMMIVLTGAPILLWIVYVIIANKSKSNKISSDKNQAILVAKESSGETNEHQTSATDTSKLKTESLSN